MFIRHLNTTLFGSLVWGLLTLSAFPAIAKSTDTFRDFEFRDTVRADTPLRLTLTPWKDTEKTVVRSMLLTLYERYPNFVQQVVKYGPVPLYRASTKQLDHINQLAYAGPIYVSFFDVRDTLYFRESVIHELVHIADSFGQFSNSAEWRALIEPRIYDILSWRTANNITKALSAWVETEDRHRPVLEAAGLPSFYAASAPPETLAEIVGAHIMSALYSEYAYQAPSEIVAYLDSTIFSSDVITYPSGEHALRAQNLRRAGKYAEAKAEYEKATLADPSNYWAQIGVASLAYGLSPNEVGQREYLDGIKQAITLISPTDIRTRLHFYAQASDEMRRAGDLAGMLDICTRIDADYPPETRGGSEYGAHKTCGNAYLANDQPEKALAEFERAVALVPFKQYEFTRLMGPLKMSLAGSKEEAWQAHNDVMLAQWKGLAEKGDPVGMLSLGKMYVWGTQTPKNYASAVKWLTRAFEEGKTEASYFLATLYADPYQDYFDLGLASYWARISADGGNKGAEFLLGRLRRQQGLYDEANVVLTKLADEGNSGASFELGRQYETEDYAEADLAIAVSWYEKAAAQNHQGAMYRLGLYYLNEAEPQDPERAVELFAKPANGGNVLAQYELGRMAGDRSYSGLEEESAAVGYYWLYRSLHNTNPYSQADLPPHIAEEAEKALARYAQSLGLEAEEIKKTVDAEIEKQRAARPWLQ